MIIPQVDISVSIETKMSYDTPMTNFLCGSVR